MNFIKKLLAFATLAAVSAAFFGVPYCDWACRLQPSASYYFIGIVILSFLWGRFFCEALCPLGTLQSIIWRIIHPMTPVRRVCSRLPESRAQRIVRLTVFALFALGLALGVGSVWAISPYSIFGKALALFVPGLVLFAVVLVLAAFGKGRLWCNWICPFGTLFSLISRVAWRKQKIGKCCKNCRACFPDAAKTKETKGESDAGFTRRETLQGVAVLAAVHAADKLTDGGYAPISYHAENARERPILPPGAGSAARFSRTCVGCDLCVRNCPGECLKPSVDWKRFGQPEMTFEKGYCIAGCTTCGRVCPARAIERLDKATKKNTHIGYAVWNSEKCIRTKDGVPCMACQKKCPVEAIHVVGGNLVIDRDACLGCGACEHVCAARPESAIVVMGLDVQRTIRPMGEADLIAEMIALVSSGDAAVVVARNGVITRRVKGSGVKPVLDLEAKGELKDALVVDKIVGRAAASAMIVGGARKVVGLVMSEGAKALLGEHGVDAEAKELVPQIINRAGTGQCPMEEKVKDENEPKKMLELLRS